MKTPEKILDEKGTVTRLIAPLLIDPKDHMRTGREFVARQYTKFTKPVLHHQNDSFYAWADTHYREVVPAEISTDLYHFLESASVTCRKGPPVAFKPNRHSVAELQAALKAVTNLPSEISPPAWLQNDARKFPADEIVACANGLLHLKT
ncbi:MAG: hypothetical protein RL274_2827, partial [Pseudomonadota bacterium]